MPMDIQGDAMAIQSKGTPGPWHVGGVQGDTIIYAADKYAIANATVYHGKHEGQTEANARIIAIAPDGVELARLIIKYFEPVTFERSLNVNEKKMLQDARAILARVDGAA